MEYNKSKLENDLVSVSNSVYDMSCGNNLLLLSSTN